MKKQTTQELSRALHEMLLKNSDHLTTEEVGNLESAIESLLKLQVLEDRCNGDPGETYRIRNSIKIELVKLVGYLLRCFLDADLIKTISDFLN